MQYWNEFSAHKSDDFREMVISRVGKYWLHYIFKTVYNAFYPNLKRNGSLHWPSSRSLPSLLPFFLSFFPSFLFLYSFTPPLLPSLSHPVHPLPPIAFLSYRKSKRLTCKWGLLNPNRPSVTSQQRQGGWGGRGAIMIWERDNQSEINWEKEGWEGRKWWKRCFLQCHLLTNMSLPISTGHVNTKSGHCVS